MAIEVYALRHTDGNVCGAILVCNTTGLPLNIPVGTFEDEEEAESFLAWCYREAGVGEPRKMSEDELDMAIGEWREWNTVAP